MLTQAPEHREPGPFGFCCPGPVLCDTCRQWRIRIQLDRMLFAALDRHREQSATLHLDPEGRP